MQSRLPKTAYDSTFYDSYYHVSASLLTGAIAFATCPCDGLSVRSSKSISDIACDHVILKTDKQI